MKSAVVTLILGRLENILISEEAKSRESEWIKTELSASAYPSSFLKHARRAVEKKKKKTRREKNSEQDFNKCICITYFKGRSEAVRVSTPLGIRAAFNSKNRKWWLTCRAKDKPPTETQLGLVGAIRCMECEGLCWWNSKNKQRTAQETQVSRAHEKGRAICNCTTHGHRSCYSLESQNSSEVAANGGAKVLEAFIMWELDNKEKEMMNQDKGMDLGHPWLDLKKAKE